MVDGPMCPALVGKRSQLGEPARASVAGRACSSPILHGEKRAGHVEEPNLPRESA